MQLKPQSEKCKKKILRGQWSPLPLLESAPDCLGLTLKYKYIIFNCRGPKKKTKKIIDE